MAGVPGRLRERDLIRCVAYWVAVLSHSPVRYDTLCLVRCGRIDQGACLSISLLETSAFRADKERVSTPALGISKMRWGDSGANVERGRKNEGSTEP